MVSLSFDLEDLDKIQKFNWGRRHKKFKTDFGIREQVYAITKRCPKPTPAHDIVMNFRPKNGLTIDHLNRNSLDNRKCNLRIANKRIQIINRNLQKNSTTGRTGVSYDSKKDVFLCQWVSNGSLCTKRYSVKKYPNAKQLASEARLYIERTEPDYTDALYNQRAIVRRLVETTGEESWEGIPITELIQHAIDAEINVEECRN